MLNRVLLALLVLSFFTHRQNADSQDDFDQDLPGAKPPQEILVLPSSGAAEPTSPAEWYGAGVRPTEARTPEEELAGFHLPDGFKIELFASEPEIAKPLNMAFDIDGRMWITDTVEYPYPAPPDRDPRDSIKILEDTDGDHHADRVRVFADKLNVPIGLLPYGDGVIAFSIPNLYYLHDNDGDGVCDKREVILGPFDTTRDTHGMVNSLRQGYDGWIYACHGFNNQSKVQGGDGWSVEMTSGNTFRFRPDGQRVEHFSHGQVNPFGMTCDAWGNWFTADCHSKPITQLLRGGYYSSFGRPDDGLGFVPPMMDHLHGSTAISGLVLYDADNFPEPYRNQFYSGNVMTSRINRNAITQTGATLKANELPDFLTSDDPWFRPVDLQIAPDGSLYVADFYNRIIGHYEVPLEHEGRDRFRGRIWRISSSASDVNRPLSTALREEDEWGEGTDPFATSNTMLRLRTLNHLAAEEQLAPAIVDSLPASPEKLWFKFRRGDFDESELLAAISDNDPRMRTHALLIAGEMSQWNAETRDAVIKHLDDDEPFAARAAAEACGRHPDTLSIDRLLHRLAHVDKDDAIMSQTMRIAIRDSLLAPEVAKQFDAQSHLAGDESSTLVSILLGLRSASAGRWLAAYLKQSKKTAAEEIPVIRHAITTLPTDEIDALVTTLRAREGMNTDVQNQVLLEVAAAGATESPVARDWATRWSRDQWSNSIEPLANQSTPRLAWQRSDASGNWPTEARADSDGTNHDYRSTFPLGESFVGNVRSDPFSAPDSLQFDIVGHDGLPKEPIQGTNEVQLLDAATGETLMRAAVPRRDQAQTVNWDLAEFAGRRVTIEVVDGNSQASYAWIAFGRFDDARFNDDPLKDELKRWFEVVLAYRLIDITPTILELLSSRDSIDTASRIELLSGVVTLRQENASIALIDAMRELPNSGDLLADLEPVILAGVEEPFDLTWLKNSTSGLTRSAQQSLAKTLARRRESLPWLVTAAREGWISGDVLRLKEVETSLTSLASDELKSMVAEVLASLPDENEELAKLSAQSLARFVDDGGDAAAGAVMFTKHCATCHQIAGVGAIVGPQLDGVGGRGAERLLEDVLQPDRNVDRAFRASSFVLDDGTVCVGLIRNETPTTIEVVENTGKSRTIDVDAIELRQTTSRSLMPSGLHETIGAAGVSDLLAYLLEQKAVAK